MAKYQQQKMLVRKAGIRCPHQLVVVQKFLMEQEEQEQEQEEEYSQHSMY